MSRPIAVASALVVAVVVGASWWAFRDDVPLWKPQSSRNTSDAAKTSTKTRSGAVKGQFVPTPENSREAQQIGGGIVILEESAETARSLHAPESTVQQDLEILSSLIEFFRRANNQANPVGGLNEEIVEQLCGQNDKRFAVIPPGHPSINPSGQLVDRWGTPYFFHPVSSKVMGIRSAGPDQKFWNEDDVQVGEENSVANVDSEPSAAPKEEVPK